MQSIKILRGVPGSGKSTYARSIPSATIVSADDFFLTPDGTYKYDRSKIQQAHEQCFRKFMEAINRGDETILVDNMNVQAWEISPYYLAGSTFGYDVEILNFTTDVETSFARNIHGVPKADIERVAKAIKTAKLPGHWKQRNFIPPS